MVSNGRSERRDRRRASQLDPVQEISTELRGPQLATARTKGDPVRHREMRQDRRDRLEIRRDIVNTTFRIGRDTPEISEVEPAAAVEHQVIRDVSCLRRNNRLSSRSIRLYRDDGTGSLEITYRSDEDPPVFVDREAAWT